ncbi:MipA/OmpV family protein [Sphingomonas pseudosanguinis]|uniref:Outer membrane scaffolding protein for murein synthesis (MipA/OmpV family) n=1 Tax=Sphingomonas pseudosanguinis TaxID=413712 RepID=A0A7W6AE49_9SPHN|nr:MipA/OmpV family protein [Sphingomonas pseudosanguinis]MBB3880494.1 outer membrane scaffolding protein for murein synthesis (MipA/OmpV family) [Sphingomonas pseudosanguinis]
MRLFSRPTLCGVAPLIASAALSLSVPAHAQDVPAADVSDAAAVGAQMGKNTITIGLGGAYLPDYQGSNDYQFTPAPAALAYINGHTITLIGNRLSVDLIGDRTNPGWDFQAGPVGVVNLDRTAPSRIDDVRVRALGKIGAAVELGGYVGIGKVGVITSPYDRLSVALSYRHDVTGVHDSGIWQPSVNYFTPLSTKAAVGLFATAEHAGSGYARRYYSINQGQSLASGLPVYNARSGWKNWTAGAIGTYSLTGNLLQGWKLVGSVAYGRMLNDFGDSPIVSQAGSRGQWLSALGVAYTF